MKKFNVSIRETLAKSVLIETNSIEEAKEIVAEMYRNSDIILTSDDFTGDVDVKVFDEEFNALEDWDENYMA